MGCGALDTHDLTVAFHAHAKRGQPFTRRMAITLADMADVPVRRMVLTLERMALLPSGSWDWFRENGGFTKEHFAEVREDNEASRASRIPRSMCHGTHAGRVTARQPSRSHFPLPASHKKGRSSVTAGGENGQA